MTTDGILARLSALHPKAIDLSLGRVERLLARLGRPQDNLPPVIHVAGTNGKGSTLAIARACLEAAGKRVHVYTSPHLVRFNERIVAAGREIGDAALEALAREAEEANAGEPITFFEITTAIAFLAFARTEADFTLLETGLGGRLDATNAARPAVCAITAIGLDHQRWLGNTVAEIAAEKAGIAKPGAPLALARQPPGAREVIERAAARAGAPLVAWSARADGAGFVFRSRRRAARFPAPALCGAHQIDNAGLALACLDALDAPALSDAEVAAGLTRARWPGRLQRLPGAREIWLDGGHNPPAGAALARAATGWRDRPLRLVAGMMRGKDPRGFLAPLAPHAEALAAIPIPGQDNAMPAEDIAAAAASLGLAASCAPSPRAALERMPGDRRALICGSLYLAGAVLAGGYAGLAGAARSAYRAAAHGRKRRRRCFTVPSRR